MKFFSHFILSIFLILSLNGCANAKAKSTKAINHSTHVAQTHQNKKSSKTEFGIASYYGDILNGHKTANGEIFNNKKLTAAHKKLPFGSYVKVTALWNNKTVVVRINDRGPYRKGRIIDLSKAAAAKLGLVGKGLGKVKIEVVSAKEAH